ncbi:MAG TPA: 3-oxoacyl-ACP reductase, partial [Lachnospiraceae bacterium]|nr:3-oxoacyl-ACP reductase [Lachnospiraceae bacterium]
GTSEEAAALIYDLAVNHPYLTGQVITMDGGWT